MERDRRARERVAVERERAVERAGEEFVRLSGVPGSGVGEDGRGALTRRELEDPDRAGCCGAPLDLGLEPEGSSRYKERHRRGVSSLGLPPSPVCEWALEADRVRDRFNRRGRSAG